MLIRKRDGTSFNGVGSSWDFSGQDLREADLKGTYIDGGNLSDCDLQGVDFSGSHLYGTYLYRANCSECDFTGALLQGVVLDEVNLSKVIFTDAQLIADNMGTPCSLLGSNLRAANLENSTLTGCKYDSTTSFALGFDPAVHGMVRVD